MNRTRALLLAVVLLAGCTTNPGSGPLAVQPRSPVVVAPTNAPSPAPTPPIPMPKLPAKVALLSTAQASATTNTDGTNIVICGIGRVTHKPYCVTNPLPAPPALTKMTLAWLETNYTAGHLWTSNEILFSTNGAAGPWNFYAWVAATNTNMQVTVPVDRKIAPVFWRVASP